MTWRNLEKPATVHPVPAAAKNASTTPPVAKSQAQYHHSVLRSLLDFQNDQQRSHLYNYVVEPNFVSLHQLCNQWFAPGIFHSLSQLLYALMLPYFLPMPFSVQYWQSGLCL